MRLLEEITDPRGLLIKAQSTPPVGPAFDAEMIREADRLEIWVTESGDKPTDYTEYRLVAGDHVIAKRRLEEY